MARKKQGKRETKNETSRGTSKNLLTRLDIEILFCVAMNTNTNKRLHERLRQRKQKLVPKSTISHHTTKLYNLGLISFQKLFNIKQFYLTAHSKLAISNFMARGQGLSKYLTPIKLEAVQTVLKEIERKETLF